MTVSLICHSFSINYRYFDVRYRFSVQNWKLVMAKIFFALVSFYDYYERRKKGEIKNSSKNMKVWCFYNTNEFIFPQPPPNFHPFSQCHDKKNLWCCSSIWNLLLLSNVYQTLVSTSTERDIVWLSYITSAKTVVLKKDTS